MSISLSFFRDIPLAPPDPILGITDAFAADTNPKKVNLGVGVYQDGQGRIPVLRTVREAEKRWLELENSKAYLPIDGLPAYRTGVQNLLFGAEHPFVKNGQLVTAQTLGGTGGLRMGADFLKRFLPESEIWVSSPTWENHRAVFEAAGMKVNEYPYYDPETRGLAFGKMTAALRQLPASSIVLLHACCHNPTGVDLDRAQWQELTGLFKQQNLVPFIDLAYQGFAEGIEQDAFAVRTFAESGVPAVVASSFSKSFSLYRERVGAVTLVTANADEAKRAASQLKRVIRTSYSNPSSHGAQVVALILGDAELRASWEAELAEMRERILRMRSLFVQKLGTKQQARDFSFVEKQRGMFSYSGLDLPRVQRLRTEFGLYIVDSGRMCVAAMNENNIDYITDAIAKVV
jgi:aromatic-amino-acid transaminase